MVERRLPNDFRTSQNLETSRQMGSDRGHCGDLDFGVIGSGGFPGEPVRPAMLYDDGRAGAVAEELERAASLRTGASQCVVIPSPRPLGAARGAVRLGARRLHLAPCRLADARLTGQLGIAITPTPSSSAMTRRKARGPRRSAWRISLPRCFPGLSLRGTRWEWFPREPARKLAWLPACRCLPGPRTASPA